MNPLKKLLHLFGARELHLHASLVRLAEKVSIPEGPRKGVAQRGNAVRWNARRRRSVGIMQMGKVLAGFMSSYPDIQVTLTVADSSRHVLDPIDFDADVAIRFSIKQSPPTSPASSAPCAG